MDAEILRKATKELGTTEEALAGRTQFLAYCTLDKLITRSDDHKDWEDDEPPMLGEFNKLQWQQPARARPHGGECYNSCLNRLRKKDEEQEGDPCKPPPTIF
ncbi:hypothetical protein PF008_g33307 [Phytophthora fragariae]|uniref:Uncharacterized protein n=1 Tax=Phytophthora fragariae TaxID=53985 RepID=A0A6G0PXU9_9STRA|nr:hypothetical protein PF008_g33307 [Phytophthora fragariae]